MRLAGVFIVIAILLATMVVGLDAALADAGTREEISDESFTPNAGTVQSLDRSNLGNTVYYDSNVSVRDENGERSFEGTDYEWFESNGTIKPLVGGNLDGDASATIDYAYRETTERQRTMAQLAAVVPQGGALILPLGFVLVAFAALRGL